MYLHIGGEYLISYEQIIGIFDLDATIDQTPDTLDFLQQAELREQMELVSPDIPRSYIVSDDRIYMSPISVATLRRRLRQGWQQMLQMTVE